MALRLAHVTLEQIRELLANLTTAAYVVLAIVSVIQWRRHRSRPAGWLALTFLAIGTVVLVGQFLPEPSAMSTAADAIRRVDIAILLLFPYFLFRFSASFQPAPRATELYAAAVTVVVILWCFFTPFVPEGSARPQSVQLFVFAALLQWVSLSLIVAVHLWKQGGAISAPVARRRMRLMSIAATLLGVGLIIAGSSADQPETFRVLTQLLALGAAVAFYLGFSPPEWIRNSWRRPAMGAVRRATGELLSASSEAEVTQRLLPIMSGVVGARGIAFFGKDGHILDQHGVTPSMLGATDGKLQGEGDQEQWEDMVVMRFPFGCLAVWTSPYSPFFGTEEFNLLRSIGNLAHLALEQTRAASLKLQVAESHLRRRQALEINDNIVQGLAVAKYAFELGDEVKAKASLDASLSAAKRIISELLEELEPGDNLRAGFLIRDRPAADPSINH